MRVKRNAPLDRPESPVRVRHLTVVLLVCALLAACTGTPATPGAPALAQTNEDAMAQMNQDGPPRTGSRAATVKPKRR